MTKKILVILPIIVALTIVVRVYYKKPNPVSLYSQYLQMSEDWKKSKHLRINSTELTNEIFTLVTSTKRLPKSGGASELVDELGKWFRALRTGTFQDFLEFRKPDYYRFSSNAFKYIIAYLPDTNRGPDQVTDLEKAEATFRRDNTVTFDILAQKSLKISYYEVKNVSQLNNGKARLSVVLPHYPPNADWLHEHTPLRYNINATNVLERHGSVDLAFFSGAFLSPKGYVIALHICFFWSPGENRWKPFEYYMGRPMPIPPDTVSPLLFF